MKLLEKTNKTYLLLTGTAFIIAGVLFYLILSLIFNNQLDEKLLSDIEGIRLSIEKNGNKPNYFPFIEVKEVPDQLSGDFKKTDTLIFDPLEKEIIRYRQISIVTHINRQTYFIASRDALFEQSDLLISIVIITGSVFFMLLFSLYFINKKLSQRIWYPFFNTLNTLKEFSHYNTDFKIVEDSDIDEFIELNNTLNYLTKKIISDYQSLKRFTEDASHEIQTPLAVIQSKLETLLQYSGLKKEQTEIINSAYTSTLRISKLTQTLLLLTKIDNNLFPDKQTVNFSVLLEEKIEIFEDHINRKELKIKKEIIKDCQIVTNYFLADSMIMNLFGNAFKYCPKNGSVNISLNSGYLTISNTGAPLSAEPSKLFDRFFKENKTSDSPGLGLSIVKRICEVNNWIINYANEGERHIITIQF
jgi:signal transduction histidine kinase